MPIESQYAVSGMTCGHCVSAVREEFGKLPGVTGVDVALVPEGKFTVTVVSDVVLAEDDVRSAVDEAGYDLVAK